jgi:hypothetical protein
MNAPPEHTDPSHAHAPYTPSPRKPVRREDYAHIKGWGADLDTANRPAYPMERMPPRLDGVDGTPPVQQEQRVKVFHSTERPGLTPVYGSTVPPTGISGGLRSVAFKFSENDLRHWLLLLFADRVHMVEGLVADLAQGHVPNVYAEMGGRAELKHNPAGAVRKALTLATAATAVYLLVRRSRRKAWH